VFAIEVEEIVVLAAEVEETMNDSDAM